MTAYARWLFGIAAASNQTVAVAMSVGLGWFVAVLGLDPVAGTNVALVDLAAVLIASFGYGYARIALDPASFRPLIGVGALGKAAAVATVLAGALTIPHLLASVRPDRRRSRIRRAVLGLLAPHPKLKEARHGPEPAR